MLHQGMLSGQSRLSAQEHSFTSAERHLKNKRKIKNLCASCVLILNQPESGGQIVMVPKGICVFFNQFLF